MKKLFLGLLMVTTLSLASVAAADTYSKPGTLTAQAGVGLYWGYYGGIDIEGGVDLGLFQVPFAPAVPVDFGVSGRVGFTTWGAYGLSAFATAHYSWEALGLKLDWLNRLESYLGIGVQVLRELWPDGYGGFAYHFDRQLAFFFEGGRFENVLGVSYRF